MKQTAQLAAIAELVKNSKRIAIMGHIGGDTDCYGSAFGLAAALEKINKLVKVVSESEFPDTLDYLFFYYTGEVVTAVESVDLLILLDSSDVARLSNPEIAKNLKQAGVKTVLLDHHVHGDLQKFVDIAVSDDTACSTSEIVFQLIETMDIEIDKNIATCLLAGIVSDTSSFQNQNTTKECFAVASELMKRGARLASIVNHTFGGKEVDVLKVWGLAMERLTVDKQSGVVSTYLTHNDILSYGLSTEAISGIVNFLNSVKGARIVMLITEEEQGTIKVSLRTRDAHIDVARLTRQLGGGGHVKAAGFSFSGSLKILTGGDKSHIVIV